MDISTPATHKVVDADGNNNFPTPTDDLAVNPQRSQRLNPELVQNATVSNNSDLFTSYKRSYYYNATPNTGTPHFTTIPSDSKESFDIISSSGFPHFTLPKDVEELPKELNLVKFITAGITNHLKTLGVEELDCKEYVETWLSHRRQKRWKQSISNPIPNHSNDNPGTTSNICLSNLQDFLKGIPSHGKGISNVIKPSAKGFNQSEPNSSLLRLSADGNEELGRFSTKMEEVRIHLNNASCTFLQGTMVLLLPYLKLLTGNHLETPSHRTFIEDWIQILGEMARELKSRSAKESKVMLTREFQSLLSESKGLYKRLSKLFKKVKTLYKENERAYKMSLGQLHPRSLTCRSRFDKKDSKDSSTNRTFLPEIIEFSPIPLYRTNIATAELFKDNIFLSRSKIGSVLLKKRVNMEWEKFTDLPFQSRRDLLLSAFEDLHWTLNSTSTGTNHIKELFIEGYPESICAKIKDNLAYLKRMSKQEELLVISKVTIANQVKSFLDTLARLVRILKDTMDISRRFYKSIKHSGLRSAPGTSWKVQVGVVNESYSSRVKLLVPFPTSADPIGDQFFMSSF